MGLLLFLETERNTRAPMLRLSRFQVRAFSGSLFANLVVSTGAKTNLVFGPFYLALRLQLELALVGLGDRPFQFQHIRVFPQKDSFSIGEKCFRHAKRGFSRSKCKFWSFEVVSEFGVDHGRVLHRFVTQTSLKEEWLRELYGHPPEDKELYRDAEHEFLLKAYTEERDRYRVPHDHGAGWVVYAVQHGEMEMGTSARIVDSSGQVKLVQRDLQRMRARDCAVYLPGDIHDTRNISRSALLFRLTSCDLKRESREGRMARYVQQSGLWTSNGSTCR